MIDYEESCDYISFKIKDFLLLTTTKNLISQYSETEETILTAPFISKEKLLSLYFFTTKYPSIFLNKVVVMCEQIHDNRIIETNQADFECYLGKLQFKNFVVDYKIILHTDGIISKNNKEIIAIFTADCIPLFVVDIENNWYGLVHIGRIGLQKGIIERLFEKLNSLSFSLKDTLFIAGPHICSNCYYVNGDKLSLFDTLFQKLLSFGVSKQQIINSGFCTFHDDRFFSFRKNATSYRLLSIITKL